MKKLLVLVIVATTCLSAFCQKGYSDFDSVANVLIKTKIAHANSKDDSSPLELSLYFQNNGNADVIVRYQIFIEDNNGEKRHSGKKEVKLKHGQKQFGKISGLTYELFGSSIDAYASGERKWYFTILEIKDMYTGELIATSDKVVDEE
ncbi:MAG: hypothetical protein IKO34_08425 [Bacteroidales bacterium]|jgi:hypothetical protein|nr:hypothetical protein [Bacteroidales bacterium]